MLKKSINIYIDSFKFGGIEKNLVSILNALNPEKYDVKMIFLHNSVGKMFEQIRFPFEVMFLCEKELDMKHLVLYSNYLKFMPKSFFRKKYCIPNADIEIIFPERIVPIIANKLTAKCKCSWNQTSIDPENKMLYFNKNIFTKLIYRWGLMSYKKIDYIICNSELCK